MDEQKNDEQKTTDAEPRIYERPIVVDYGDIFEITAAALPGGAQDVNFAGRRQPQTLVVSRPWVARCAVTGLSVRGSRAPLKRRSSAASGDCAQPKRSSKRFSRVFPGSPGVTTATAASAGLSRGLGGFNHGGLGRRRPRLRQRRRHRRLRAMGRWLPEHLPRRSRVVAWDEARRSGFVAVDRLAAASVFVVESQGALLFATELAPLLRLLERRPPVDEVAAVSWLATGSKPLGATFFAGVRRLGAGEVVTITNGRISSRRYWEPTYRGVAAVDTRDLAAAVRQGVREAVLGRLDAPARRDLPQRRARLHIGRRGCSLEWHRPPFGLHGNVPGLRRARRKRPRQGSCGGARATGRVHAGAGLEAPAGCMAYLQRWHVPSPTPNLFLRRRLIDAARAGGAERVLDGEGGDELFAFAPYYVADLVRKGRVTQALTLVRRFHGLAEAPSTRVVRIAVLAVRTEGGTSRIARPLVRRLRAGEPATPGWLTDRAARLLATADEQWAWKERDGPLWWRERVDQLVDGRQRMDITDNLRRIEYTGDAERAPLPRVAGPRRADAQPAAGSLVRPGARPASAARGEPRAASRLGAPAQRQELLHQLFRDSLEGEDGGTIEELLDPKHARVRAFVRLETLHEPARRDGQWNWRMWRSVALEMWLRWLEDDDFPAAARRADGAAQISVRRSYSGSFVGSTAIASTSTHACAAKRGAGRTPMTTVA